jgi:TRAP-type mannitol/chloroaromatic compound transport system substrate-binding protein
MTDVAKRTVSRRKFLKSGTIAAGAAAGALAMPSVVTAQSPVVIKMQSSWPATDIFQEMAGQYVERVAKMSNNRLKIDLLPAGAVVGAFDVQDACHDGAIDAAHTVPVYWYGKHKGASLFGTGPVFGGTGNDMVAWFYQGGGKDFYRELVQDILGLNLVGFYAFGMPAQPLGWFKNEITGADQLNGLKYRTVGLAADLFQAMGVSVTQLPGGEIVPAMDRGVIDAFEFNNPTSDSRFGAQDVAKNYMLGSYHQASESFEFMFNKDRFESLDPDLQAILEHGVEAMGLANNALAMRQYSDDLQKLIAGGINVKRTPQSILEAQLAAWDQVIPTLEADAFNKKVLDSQRAWVEKVGFYQIMNAPSYQLAFDHYYPGKIPS